MFAFILLIKYRTLIGNISDGNSDSTKSVHDKAKLIKYSGIEDTADS